MLIKALSSKPALVQIDSIFIDDPRTN